MCSLCKLTVCNFGYFPFWFWVRDLGSDCPSSWSVHTCFFSYGHFQGVASVILGHYHHHWTSAPEIIVLMTGFIFRGWNLLVGYYQFTSFSINELPAWFRYRRFPVTLLKYLIQFNSLSLLKVALIAGAFGKNGFYLITN